METRKESLSSLKVCRFCLTQNESLSSLYEKSKAPKNSVALSTKIMTCVAIEVFPSDKMPQYICNRCKLFMDISYDFKQICRQADQSILHFVQNGTTIESISWPSLLKKVCKSHIKSEVGVVKTVTQDGATVKVTAEEVSDSEEGDDDNVYSVKIGEGSEKCIKVINVENQDNIKDNHKKFPNITKLGKHLRSHAGERAYPCKHCDKSFLKSHHYTRHLRVKHSDMLRPASGTYTEAEAYRCEECEECFRTQDELIYHSALHATRSLTCPLCQEKFTDVDTVTAHIKSHVNGAEFMCDFCELIFTTQEKLDTHIAMSHDNDLNDKDMTENEEDDCSMDTEGYDEEHSFNLKEVDGQVVVEIKKAGDYMIPDLPMEDDEKNVIDQSEGSELQITLNDATRPLLESMPVSSDDPPKQARPVNKRPETNSFTKSNPGVSITRLDLSKVNANTTNAVSKPIEIINESPSILKKAEEVKQITVQKQASPVPNIPVVKEKPVKAEVTTVTPASATTLTPVPAPSNDLSLRLLEKELQDLQRTNIRNDIAKTPAKPMESLKNKRSQIHTSTPKPRPIEKKEIPTTKPAPERPLQEKTPKAGSDKPVTEKRQVGRPPKENREVKNIIKEDKETKDKAVNVKEDKETKEVKKDEKEVVKNGATEKELLDEPVRRSTRPSKIKDYAKMIRDSPDEDEVSTEDEEMEESMESDKSTEVSRRGRKPKTTPLSTPSPGMAPRKRGRPRKIQAPIPEKISKKEGMSIKEESDDEVSELAAAEETKPVEEEAKAADVSITETKNKTIEPASNVIVSPSGQTLKKVPIKALPPGVKPMPLPRKMASGEVCEMQIGKKVVKVQKIVMTKAEVEAMTKKGLVEMKDGTIVLKQGIKLPGGASTLKSQLTEEQKKESPKSGAKPTRCDLGEE